MTHVLPVMLAVTVVAVAQPSAAFAQCPETRAKRPLFVAGIRNDKPLREAGSGGILIPIWDLEYGDPGCGVPAYRGLLVEASAGIGGRRVAVGLARRIKAHGQPALFGEDVLVSVVQTTASSLRVMAAGGWTWALIRIARPVQENCVPPARARTVGGGDVRGRVGARSARSLLRARELLDHMYSVGAAPDSMRANRCEH